MAHHGSEEEEPQGGCEEHIAPLVRSVDLYDYICVIIAYISTFLVDYKSTIYVGNESWRFIFSDFS